MTVIRDRMEQLIRAKQLEIVKAMERFEIQFLRKPCHLDELVPRWPHWRWWDSAVIRNGHVIEKGAANISIINGFLPPAAVRRMRAITPPSLSPRTRTPPPLFCLWSEYDHALPRTPRLPLPIWTTATLRFRTQMVPLRPGGLAVVLTFTPHYLFDRMPSSSIKSIRMHLTLLTPKYYPSSKSGATSTFTLSTERRTVVSVVSSLTICLIRTLKSAQDVWSLFRCFPQLLPNHSWAYH